MARSTSHDTPYVRPDGGIWVDRLRFPPGLWTYRAQGTPDCLLLVTIGGHGRLIHEHGAVDARRGDVFLLMPHARHDYGALQTGDWTVDWSHFVPPVALLEHIRWPQLASGIGHLAIKEPRVLQEASAALVRGRQRRRQGPPLGIPLAENAVAEALLLCDAANPLRSATDTRVRLAIDHLGRHIAEPITVAAVAAASGLSVSRISRLFQEQTGFTIQGFLEARRMEIARSRLALTAEPITQIAMDLGFGNPFYFSRRFHHHEGMGPRAYRQRQRRAPESA